MRPVKFLKLNWCQRLLKTSFVALLLVTLSIGLSGAFWNSDTEQPVRESRLAQGNAITDGKALLRYALPIDNQGVRDIQASLEDIANELRGKRWSAINRDITKADVILSNRPEKVLADIPEAQKPQAETIIQSMRDDISSLREAVEGKDKNAIWIERGKILDKVGELEQMMVKEFPFEVPAEYSNLPQLKGRATIKIATNKGNMTVVVDGYSAPVTAGNFVDLVQRGFYDGLTITRMDELYVQTGDPPGSDAGFIDPKTGEYRAIPLEVLVRGDEAPIYGMTLEEAGIYLDPPALPFSAYGTVAMARPGDDPNGGSSQFFFFKFDTELTPPGFNLMDGRYAVFGYLTEGKDVLANLELGDTIESAKVIQGIEYLLEPDGAA